MPFDALTQGDANTALSLANSYTRPALGGKAPFDLFAFIRGASLLAGLGPRRIPASEIVPKPSLLGQAGPHAAHCAARPGGRTQRGSLSLSEKRGRGAPRPSSHFFGGRDAENTARTPATERTAPRQAPFRTD